MKIDGVEVINGDIINIINQPNFIGRRLIRFWNYLYIKRNTNQNGIYKVIKIETYAN